MTIYLDLVLILNFAVNYLLLRGTARLGAACVQRGRTAAGAAIGALYAVAVYLPHFAWLSQWVIKLLVGAGMLIAVFGLRRSTLRMSAIFLAMSLVLCGAVYAVELLRGGTVRYYRNSLLYPVSFGSLLLTATAVCAACRLLLPRLRYAADSMLPLTLELNGRSIKLTALRDSGNTLIDPVSGASVLTVEWQCAAQLLPEESLTRRDFSTPTILALRLKQYHPRLIPYRAVGVERGLLLALPCRITLENRTQIGLAAFSPTPLSDSGIYQALTGAENMERTAILC